MKVNTIKTKYYLVLARYYYLPKVLGLSSLFLFKKKKKMG